MCRGERHLHGLVRELKLYSLWLYSQWLHSLWLYSLGQRACFVSCVNFALESKKCLSRAYCSSWMVKGGEIGDFGGGYLGHLGQ